MAAIDKHRLAGLQDGVYSIAMTLLVLELKLPTLPEHVSDALLWSTFLSIWPKLLTWLLSFSVLAVFWVGDVRTVTALATVDSFMLRMGLLRLALVSLLPFSTAFIGEYGSHVAAAAVYAAHLFVLSFAQLLRNVYLRSHPDVGSWPTSEAAKDAMAQSWGMLACSAAALGLAFVVPGYNMLALLPMAFVNRLDLLWRRA